MDLNEVAVFIKVVQNGSFSKAAKMLNMPVSTVSFKVSSLEKRLGLTLIQRTTRKLHITPAGEAYYRRCLEGLTAIEAAESEVTAVQSEPNGLLRVTTFFEVASSVLPQVVSQFLARHPKVRVELIITDRMVDLISENVDLAIRAGELRDSGMIAKRVGASHFGLFASREYLRKKGVPEHPRELHKHQTLQFTPLGMEEWKLHGPTGAYNAPLGARVLINNISSTKAMAVMGDGIANLPTYFAEAEVREKKLVRVLPEWRSSLSPVHFVYPAQKFVPPKLSAFMAFALEPIRKSMGS